MRELTVKESSDPAWSRPPALRVIDCVLSLNRSYDSFVVPRLDRFTLRYPSVRSVSDLDRMVASSISPHQFVLNHLNYNHEARANTLAATLKWLVTIGGRGSEQEQVANLECWAADARPEDYCDLAIRGFGLAGYQYLRMLFGANTAKPDIYILRFVMSRLGRRVSPLNALRLLERAARMSGVRLRDLDTSIWEASARRDQCADSC